MTDYTIPGLVAIVVIVLVAAFVFNPAGQASQAQPSPATSLTGQVTSSAQTTSTPAVTCQPARYCDGSKLIIVREDCSLAQAYCQSGCVEEPQTVCR